MKTTIDLPDDLLIEAKRRALARRTTLRALVLSGLRRELALGDATHGLGAIAEVGGDDWKTVDADRYIESGREGWE